MFLLNLTLGQLLVVAGSLTAITTLLYLIDRARRSMQVSTLRFWSDAEKPAVSQRRKQIQQPVSLLLQLLGLLLLLLALAQPRFGGRDALPGRHVILLDTSSWMNARSASDKNRTLMDEARDQARAYLRALPSRDEVMLISVNALATPLTAFVTSREEVEGLIAGARPDATALHLQPALAFAQKVQQTGSRHGEIAYVGPARIKGSADAITAPANLRVISVPDRVNNVGITRVVIKRSPNLAEQWEIFIAVRNYSASPRTTSILAGFDGAPIGGRQLSIAASSEKEVVFSHRSHAKGILDVRLLEPDDFARDNQAVIEVPGPANSIVTVYTDAPQALKPLFAANSRWTAVFRPKSQYNAEEKGLAVFDRFAPAQLPAGDAIYLNPPRAGSPVAVRTSLAAPAQVHWSTHAIAAGLRSHDFRLNAATVFSPGAQDEVVASVDAGPVIVAHNGQHRMLVVGFEPALSNLRYELATPLLFANLLQWLLPDSFRTFEVNAESVGNVLVDVQPNIAPTAIAVTRQDGSPLPFSLRDQQLHFFSGLPGRYTVRAGQRESVYSLTLPEMWDAQWQPSASVRRGIPRVSDPGLSHRSRDVWQVLAIFGTFCFVLEWLLFGKMNRALRTAAAISMPRFRKAS